MSEHRRHDWDVGRFDRWSSRYDKSLFQPLFFGRVHRAIVEALRPGAGERVLDVGCGTGKLAAAVSEASGARTTGVDPAAGMVAEAGGRRGDARVSFAAASAEHLPFPTGGFDAAVTAVSAHHWSDSKTGFAELARVVRPGGRAVVADVGSLGAVVQVMRKAKMVDPAHHPGWKPRELADLMYEAGFHSVRSATRRIMNADVVFVSARR